TDLGDWSVEGGSFTFGTPSFQYAPAPLTGQKVAGTGLAGNYNINQDSRLVTPSFVVPGANESPRFKYSDWYSLSDDYGQLQVSVAGGAWQDVPGERVTGFTGQWAQRVVDLTPYAGQLLRLGFHFVSGPT